MAKFLQKTIEESAVVSKKKGGQSVESFSLFMHKVFYFLCSKFKWTEHVSRNTYDNEYFPLAFFEIPKCSTYNIICVCQLVCYQAF